MPKGVYVRGEFSKHSNNRGTDVERLFWMRVDKENGPIHPVHGKCWVWIAATVNGYGHFREKKAHRIAYELTGNVIKSGLFVLHKCDTPRCVRPDHLFQGTVQDNSDDMVSKGRQSRAGTGTPCPGAANGNARMTEEQVKIARFLYSKGWSISRIYAVTKPKVSEHALADAVKKRTWRNLL